MTYWMLLTAGLIPYASSGEDIISVTDASIDGREILISSLGDLNHDRINVCDKEKIKFDVNDSVEVDWKLVNESDSYTLENNTDNLNGVEFFINKKSVGIGEDGYKSLLSIINNGIEKFILFPQNHAFYFDYTYLGPVPYDTK